MDQDQSEAKVGVATDASDRGLAQLRDQLRDDVEDLLSTHQAAVTMHFEEILAKMQQQLSQQLQALQQTPLSPRIPVSLMRQQTHSTSALGPPARLSTRSKSGLQRVLSTQSQLGQHHKVDSRALHDIISHHMDMVEPDTRANLNKLLKKAGPQKSDTTTEFDPKPALQLDGLNKEAAWDLGPEKPCTETASPVAVDVPSRPSVTLVRSTSTESSRITYPAPDEPARDIHLNPTATSSDRRPSHDLNPTSSTSSKHLSMVHATSIADQDRIRFLIDGPGSSGDLMIKDVRRHWLKMLGQERCSERSVSSKKKTSIRQGRDQESDSHQQRNKIYEITMIFLIFLNSALVGVQVEREAATDKENASLPLESQKDYSPVWATSEWIFCVIFTLELLCRVYMEGCVMFFSSDWAWSLFDTFVVSVMIVEKVVEGMVSEEDSHGLHSMSILRVFRVIRILRVLRIVRILKFFRELRMMMSSILGCLRSLIWSMLVMSMMFYIFGIALVQGCVEHLNDTDGWDKDDTQLLRKYFGSLSAAVLSLYLAMSSGLSWGELYEVLRPVNAIYIAIFLFFISFAIFALVNVVTGVFVESAMCASQQDREALIQEEMRQKESYLTHIKAIFEEMDELDTQSIDMAQFEESLKDERMVAFFNALQLDITDVQTLFVLLDRDQTGLVDIEEFMLGCMRLKGSAKSLDIAKLQYETEFVIHQVTTLSDLVTELLQYRMPLEPSMPSRDGHNYGRPADGHRALLDEPAPREPILQRVRVSL